MEISFYRGDNHQSRFRFKNFTGTFDNIYFTAKCPKRIKRISKKLGAGIELKDGWYYINFLPEDTNDLAYDLAMTFDIKIVISGEKYTVYKGNLKLKENITTPDCEV